MRGQKTVKKRDIAWPRSSEYPFSSYFITRTGDRCVLVYFQEIEVTGEQEPETWPDPAGGRPGEEVLLRKFQNLGGVKYGSVRWYV
jgi:hypothetical protein